MKAQYSSLKAMVMIIDWHALQSCGYQSKLHLRINLEGTIYFRYTVGEMNSLRKQNYLN